MPSTTPEGPSRLAIRWKQAADQGPAAQAEVVVAHLQSSPDWADTTSRRLTEIVTALAARQDALGRGRLDQFDVDDARAFVHAVTRRGQAPAVATMHLRRTAIRAAVTAMQELGATCRDPTTTLDLPAKHRSCHRPLEPAELTMLRVAAASRNRRRIAARATVALAEAGATTGEIARLTWRQIRLDPGEVDLAGAGTVRPRTVQLTAWGRRALADHRPTRQVVGGELVVYCGGADPDSETAQAAITSRLGRLLTAAGLTDPDLRPGSVRLCLPANRLADDHRIDLAARHLGLASLDITADLLGWDWEAA